MNSKVVSQDKVTTTSSPIALSSTKAVDKASHLSKSGPIRSKIEALSEKIKSEGPLGKTGKALREKAVTLILKNAGSPEWKDYMKLFGFNEDELHKLLPDKNTKKNVALAYLVGNGPCGAASTDAPTHALMFGITDALDK